MKDCSMFRMAGSSLGSHRLVEVNLGKIILCSGSKVESGLCSHRLVEVPFTKDYSVFRINGGEWPLLS